MPEYKLDLSYTREGTVHLHVFDLSDDDSEGPVETCSVGEELDSDELRKAWMRFMTGTANEFHAERTQQPPKFVGLREDEIESEQEAAESINIKDDADSGDSLFGDMDDEEES